MTLADNVECPSLSPDGTRLAFKQARADGDPAKAGGCPCWTCTLRVTPLAEPASVDDQAAWLDATRRVHPGAARGSGRPDVGPCRPTGGAPRLLVPGAESPAAVTPAP